MAPPDDQDPPEDRTAKQLIDAATSADLERWFGLPSFQELADKGVPPPEDPEMAAIQERRAKAIAAVDPAMVEAHRKRVESGDSLIMFRPIIDVVVDESPGLLDMAMIDRQHTIAEPREVEIPALLQDDLNECTPQAILRDLHRPELDFEKIFEIVDMAADLRVDVVALVVEAMTTKWKVEPPKESVFHEGRALIAELRDDRRRSIAHFLPTLPNRRVKD